MQAISDAHFYLLQNSIREVVLKLKSNCHTGDMWKFARSWKQFLLLCPPDTWNITGIAALNCACDCLSMLGLKLIYACERGPWHLINLTPPFWNPLFYSRQKIIRLTSMFSANLKRVLSMFLLFLAKNIIEWSTVKEPQPRYSMTAI